MLKISNEIKFGKLSFHYDLASPQDQVFITNTVLSQAVCPYVLEYAFVGKFAVSFAV